MTIIDPSVSDSIAVVGVIERADLVRDLLYQEPYLALVEERSIVLYDISDPSAPVRLLSRHSPHASDLELEMGRGVAYALGDSLHVLRWEDRPTLETVARIDIPGVALDASIDLSRDAILVAAGYEGAYTIDVSLPAEPVLSWQEEDLESFPPNDAFLTANRLYLSGTGGGMPGASRGLTVVDISDPDAPQWNGSDLGRPRPTAVAAHEDDEFAYTLDPGTEPQMHIWDVADWNNPSVVDSLQPRLDAHHLLVEHDTLYVVGLGVQIFDISDESAPEEIGWLEFGGHHSSADAPMIRVGGRKLIVEMNLGEIAVIDVSVVSSPELLFLGPIEGIGDDWLRGSAGNGRFVFTVSDEQIFTIDFEDPGDPTIVASIPTPSDTYIYGFYSMAIDQDWLYLIHSGATFEDLPYLHTYRIDAGGRLRETTRFGPLASNVAALTARNRHIFIGGQFGFGWFVDDSRPTSVEPVRIEGARNNP